MWYCTHQPNLSLTIHSLLCQYDNSCVFCLLRPLLILSFTRPVIPHSGHRDTLRGLYPKGETGCVKDKKAQPHKAVALNINYHLDCVGNIGELVGLVVLLFSAFFFFFSLFLGLLSPMLNIPLLLPNLYSLYHYAQLKKRPPKKDCGRHLCLIH